MYFLYKDFKLYYEKYGTGEKTILILPGWGNTRKTFDYLINFFKQKYTVYIIDWPGWGNSNFPNTNLTVYDYADLINNFINDLDLNNLTLIGHSFGGRIIILLTGYYKKTYDKIILMGSAGIKHKKSLFKILKQTTYKLLKKLKFIVPKKIRKKYLDFLIAIFGSSDYKNLSNNMRHSFSNIVNEDLSLYLKDIENEVLLIWGDKDIDTPLKDGRKINKMIKESTLIILNGTHYVYLENIYIVNNIIYEYIK